MTTRQRRQQMLEVESLESRMLLSAAGFGALAEAFIDETGHVQEDETGNGPDPDSKYAVSQSSTNEGDDQSQDDDGDDPQGDLRGDTDLFEGKIDKKTDDGIRVVNSNGKTEKFVVDDNTKVVDEDGNDRKLREGQNVEVEYKMDGRKQLATKITIVKLTVQPVDPEAVSTDAVSERGDNPVVGSLPLAGVDSLYAVSQSSSIDADNASDEDDGDNPQGDIRNGPDTFQGEVDKITDKGIRVVARSGETEKFVVNDNTKVVDENGNDKKLREGQNVEVEYKKVGTKQVATKITVLSLSTQPIDPQSVSTAAVDGENPVVGSLPMAGVNSLNTVSQPGGPDIQGGIITPLSSNVVPDPPDVSEDLLDAVFRRFGRDLMAS